MKTIDKSDLYISLLNEIIEFRKDKQALTTSHTLTLKEYTALMPKLKIFRQGYTADVKNNAVKLTIPLEYFKNGKLKGW